MKSKIKSLISSTFFISMFNKALGFLTMLIIYKVFEKEIIGQFNVYVVYISFFTSILLLGSEQSLLKKLIHKRFNKVKRFLSFYVYFITSIFILSVLLSLVFAPNNYFTLMLLIIGLYMILEKYYEMYFKYKNKYDMFLKFQSIILFISLFLYFIYFYFEFSFNALSYLIFVKMILLILLLLFIYEIIIKSISIISSDDLFNNFKKIIFEDKSFIMLLIVSNIAVYIDKIIISFLIDYRLFADFSLLVSFIVLIYSMKIIFANKYIYLIKHSKFYLKKTKTESLKYTFIVGFFSFFIYLFITKYYLTNYEFLYIPFLIVFLLILLESALGAAGPVITYIYNPMTNVYFEILNIFLILTCTGLYILFLRNNISEIVFFSITVYSIRLLIAYLKLNYIKEKGKTK